MYLRSATGDRASLQEWEQACRAAASRHNPAWQIGDDLVFADPNASGIGHDRPGLATLLNQAKAKAFDMVIVATPDSFSRNMAESLQAIDLLAHHGVGVHIASTALDSRIPSFRDLFLYGRCYEEKLLRTHGENVSRGQLGALLRGGSVGGRCYG